MQAKTRTTGRTITLDTVPFKYPGKGGWTFAPVPKSVAPKPTRPWGRTPVVATVDGVTWTTSLWRDTKSDRSLLAVPAAKRPGKGHGNTVRVELRVIADADD